MSELDKRIAQFQNMAQADPENEMAHFSLGGALVQAGRHAEASESYLRCTELAPTMSKAYQLAAESLLACGETEQAAQVGIRGYTIASERGDLMPKRALADLLERLGKPVPEIASSGGGGGSSGGRSAREVNLLGGGGAGGHADGPIPPGSFVDHKTGRPGTQLARPPFRGPVGQWIFEHISRETFDDWIRQGTKVINELRLDLSRDQDEEAYDQHMRDYLGIDQATYDQLTAASGSKIAEQS